MDANAEKKRKRHLEAVQRYFEVHRGELKHIGMTWPIRLLERVDEAAVGAGLSRRAWILGVCEKELARLIKRRRRKAE